MTCLWFHIRQRRIIHLTLRFILHLFRTQDCRGDEIQYCGASCMLRLHCGTSFMLPHPVPRILRCLLDFLEVLCTPAISWKRCLSSHQPKCAEHYRNIAEASWNVMAHAQKPDIVFRRNGRIQLNKRGASVQSTTGSRGVRISGSNAGYTMFRGSVKSTGYPLHSPVSPSLPLPCVTVCHHISTGVYYSLRSVVQLEEARCLLVQMPE